MSINSINYSVFSEEQIKELAKIPQKKYRDRAIKILEYLKNKNGDQLCNKKELIGLFDGNRITIEKVIETLEDTLAVSYQVFSPSYIYEITPIGLKMLEILKEERGADVNE